MRHSMTDEYIVEAEDSVVVTPMPSTGTVSMDLVNSDGGREEIVQVVLPLDRLDELMVDLTRACEKLAERP